MIYLLSQADERTGGFGGGLQLHPCIDGTTSE
jgi:hypothetical protein